MCSDVSQGGKVSLIGKELQKVKNDHGILKQLQDYSERKVNVCVLALYPVVI